MKRFLKDTIRRLLNKFGFEIHRISFNDPFLAQRELLKQVKVNIIFDIGAHIGNITAIYKKVFPDSTIYCFEPSPSTFKILQKRFKNDTSVKVFRIAISDKTGETQFFINKNEATNSLLPVMESSKKFVNNIKDLETKNIIKVFSSTLDEFCEDKNIEEIHILKMDIQGAELKALKGAERMLTEKRIWLIFTEIMFIPLYKNQSLFHDICKFLYEKNYFLFNFYNLRYTPSLRIKWGDAIFLNPRVIS